MTTLDSNLNSNLDSKPDTFAANRAASAAILKSIYAANCVQRHVLLIGDLPLQTLYDAPLNDWIPGVLARIDAAPGLDVQDSPGLLISLLCALQKTLGSLTLTDIATRPLDDFSKSDLYLFGEIRGAGIALPLPTPDNLLRFQRVVALKSLMTTAPEATFQRISRSPQSLSPEALAAVQAAKRCGVLPLKPSSQAAHAH